MKKPKNKFFSGDVVELINANEYTLWQIKGEGYNIGHRFHLRTYWSSDNYVYWLEYIRKHDRNKCSFLVNEFNIMLYKRTFINKVKALFI